MKRIIMAALAVALLLAVVALGGCTGGGASSGTGTGATTSTPAATKGPITVGSKIDTEGDLLGNIIVQALEANGFKVNNKVQTGTTDVVRKALLAGEIDIYPEYTGSGLIFFKNQNPAVYQNPEQGYQTVKKLDLQQNNVVWLTPVKANNTWAIAAKKDFVAKNGLSTMSDFAMYVNDGGQTKLAGSDEFFTNKDAFPQFEKTYGFTLKPNQKLVLSGGNTAQTEKAVADGTDGVNFGMAYGTDGGLSALGLVVLKDDKNAQLVYWPTPIARGDVIKKYPEIATILEPIFNSLDLVKLQELNGRIQVNGEPASAVAADYLKTNGFIK